MVKQMLRKLSKSNDRVLANHARGILMRATIDEIAENELKSADTRESESLESEDIKVDK